MLSHIDNDPIHPLTRWYTLREVQANLQVFCREKSGKRYLGSIYFFPVGDDVGELTMPAGAM
jgi:hypothetical protein